jgi:hypothetical protein
MIVLAVVRRKAEILDFRAAGNKWPIIHAWLRDRLKD